jgi:hypothetical protein
LIQAFWAANRLRRTVPTGVYRRNGRKDLAKTDGKSSCAGSIAFIARSIRDAWANLTGIFGWVNPLTVVKNTQNWESTHSAEAMGF